MNPHDPDGLIVKAIVKIKLIHEPLSILAVLQQGLRFQQVLFFWISHTWERNIRPQVFIVFQRMIVSSLELPLFKGNRRVFVRDAHLFVIGKHVVIDRWFVSLIIGRGSIVIEDPAPADFLLGTSVRTTGPDDEWTIDDDGRMYLNGIPTNLHSGQRNDTSPGDRGFSNTSSQPPFLEISRNRPFSPFFCLFRPFPEGAKSSWEIQKTEEKGLFPQISSDLLKPPALKPPFPALQRKIGRK